MAKNIKLLYGDEHWLIEEQLKKLRGQPDGAPLEVEQFDVSRPDLEQLTAVLLTPPLLFTGPRLLLFKHADLNLKEWNGLLEPLSRLDPGTTVVIWADRLDQRTRFFKQLSRLAEVTACQPFQERDQAAVVAWVRRRAEELGRPIAPEAAERLVEVCGSVLMKLNSELAKLATYLGERPLIERADVEALASPGQLSSFALSAAVGGRRLAEALAACQVLLREKVDHIQLIGLLASRLRTMLAVKGARDLYPLAGLIGGKPEFLRYCADDAKRYSRAELVRGLELLLEADLALKSGGQPATVFDLLLTELCAPSGTSHAR